MRTAPLAWMDSVTRDRYRDPVGKNRPGKQGGGGSAVGANPFHATLKASGGVFNVSNTFLGNASWAPDLANWMTAVAALQRAKLVRFFLFFCASATRSPPIFSTAKQRNNNQHK